MTLKAIFEKVEQFKVTEGTPDAELSIFFDDIGGCIAKIGPLNAQEKEIAINVFLNFLRRQPCDLEENFSFVHLIESFDDPTENVYNLELLKFNKETPTLTSILLLNRCINTLKGDDVEKGRRLFKEISEQDKFSRLVKEEAKSYYEYQLKK